MKLPMTFDGLGGFAERAGSLILHLSSKDHDFSGVKPATKYCMIALSHNRRAAQKMARAEQNWRTCIGGKAVVACAR